MNRRCLLRAALSAAQLSLLLGMGLAPRHLLAAWPERAFNARGIADVEALLFGDREVEDSDQISIDVPDIAENGASVPVEVQVKLQAVKSLTLVAHSNPFPLLARAHFTPGVEPKIAMRVKLGGTGKLTAIVEADGSLYRAARRIKVTAGGCGG